MLVDIISDLHLDSWFGYKTIPNKEMVISFWRSLKPKGDYLIVAGDIGHNVLQNVSILKILKEVYYKEIIIVLGNHDHYLIGFNVLQTAQVKAKKSKKLYRQNGIIVLDGTVVELEGIKFGGAMGWYNSAYAHKNKHSLRMLQSYSGDIEAFLQELWGNCLNDKTYMNIAYFDELYQEEYAKLEAVHQACDVMVSHYNPSTKMEFQTKGFERDETTSFFCFDGEALAIKTTAKVWIYGHTHERKMYIWHNKKFVTSALGYQNEHYKGKIVTREIV